MAVKGIPTYQYRKYEFGGDIQEFNVKYENSEIIIESDDFKIAMDFHSFEEIREKFNSVYEELI